MKLQLPTMNWLQYGKPYTGSLGTDPMRGCLSVTTFNYRAQLVKNENVSTIKATCYLEPPWNCDSCEKQYISEDFEATKSGIKAAEKWLLSCYEVFLHMREENE